MQNKKPSMAGVWIFSETAHWYWRRRGKAIYKGRRGGKGNFQKNPSIKPRYYKGESVPGGQWFELGLCCRVVSLDNALCHSLHGCINGYWQS